MKKSWITALMTLLVGCSTYANANTGQVTFEAGYRRDNIEWKSHFPSHDPIVEGSTKFKDLDIFQIGVGARATICRNVYVRGNAYWGWILDGDFERKASVNISVPSYLIDEDVHVGFFDSHKSTVDDQYVFGLSAAVGYPFYFCDCTMAIAPVIGYSFDEQNVRAHDRDIRLFESYGDEEGGCCDRTFISRWYGGLVGLDFDWHPCNACFNIWAQVEYHWGSFRGKTSHGFDEYYDFDSVLTRDRHSHRATAWLFAAGFEYDLCNCWVVGLSVKFQDWSAHRHHRNCFEESSSYGEFDIASRCDGRASDSNKWRSYAINLNFGRDF